MTTLPSSFAQENDLAKVGKDGIMRWEKTGEEVKGFGVNYTVPFAHAYRMATKMGISHEEAIQNDVYHFSRLGLDLFRVHVWDTEISDTLGNLLENEHLRLFDYLVQEVKSRGMKMVITPIAYWGNGWPEPDEDTPGFSHKYGKAKSLTDPDAIKAQENYLYQFLNHVNPYTDLALKDDPDVIALEISNEPHHSGKPDKVTEFINTLSRSIRETGTQKPIFYNMSHSIHLIDSYLDADIQGSTFQWYPVNLVAGHEIKGNFLPHVDDYTIPFANNPLFKSTAKIVYEFDPADIGASYMYPAMARSFRTAGFQLAAQFAYDPTYLAPYNTEYGTHYMNLVYAPQKALSLKIASEVFHQIPIYKDFGTYPDNTTFGNFKVDYEQDLAELVSTNKFFYTNNTHTVPKDISSLREIAGFGNSPVIQYGGTGAYFLDKLEEGVWRLEIMPDAAWVNDPFGKTSPQKEVAVVHHRERSLRIDLPDLGRAFQVIPLNEGNTYSPKVENHHLKIRPGAYLLQQEGKNSSWTAESTYKNIQLKEYAAPQASSGQWYVLHQMPGEVTAGKDLKLTFEIIGPEKPEEVTVYMNGEPIQTIDDTGFTYYASIPASKLQTGFLSYHLSIQTASGHRTFPENIPSHPKDWDFYGETPYRTRVVPAHYPIMLLDPGQDHGHLMRRWVKGIAVQPSPEKTSLVVDFEKIPAYSTAQGEVQDYSFRLYFGDKVKERQRDLALMQKLQIKAKALHQQETWLQISLVTKAGFAYGGNILLSPQMEFHELPLDQLRPVKAVNLPSAYPGFLPYYFDAMPKTTVIPIEAVESLQISLGPGLSQEEKKRPVGVEIQQIRLVREK